MSFQNPVDIGNRALQHCGLPRISDFNEDSPQAGEISFVYDKLRRAELRRNVWQFSIRKAALRPFADGTMLVAPVMWASTTTYGYGAIVSDQQNILWQSRAHDNLNNQPGGSAQWELYCGPITAQPFDSSGTTGYFAGEIVYATPGDGTYTVYLSLQSGNSQDPRAYSDWLATKTYQHDDIIQQYAAWAIGTTYAKGDTKRYNLQDYVSLVAGNLGNQPDQSPTKWAITSQTLAPPYYDSTATYSQGQFVSYGGSNYASVAGGNIGNTPSAGSAFWAKQAAGSFFVSLIDFNLNNTPASAPALWDVATTYGAAATVGASDGYIYSSIAGGNLGNDPTSTTGFWTNTGVLNPWTSINKFGNAAITWMQLNIALVDMLMPYPIGAGPAEQSATKNVFHLPANFLRRAPQDPKAGSVSFLGAPTGLMYDDWELENGMIVSRESNPIVLRFAADIFDVNTMDDMFCEGLAARIAFEVVERLTQSTVKRVAIAAAYKTVMTEARMVNGIETGATEPPEDDYVTCRI